MEKTIARLFRDPESAQKAVGELLAKGYKQENIGVLLRLKDGRRLLSLIGSKANINLPKVGEVTALGALARQIPEGKEEADKTLAKVIGATTDTYAYYEFGLSTGSILITVNGTEEHLSDALRVLRSFSDALPIGKSAPNPGFNNAARMSATDPLDAKMTGDFRRY